jgi:hypothetical protein
MFFVSIQTWKGFKMIMDRTIEKSVKYLALTFAFHSLLSNLPNIIGILAEILKGQF